MLVDSTELGVSTLTITDLLQGDMATYTCLATNPAGRAQRNVSVVVQRKFSTLFISVIRTERLVSVAECTFNVT